MMLHRLITATCHEVQQFLILCLFHRIGAGFELVGSSMQEFGGARIVLPVGNYTILAVLNVGTPARSAISFWSADATVPLRDAAIIRISPKPHLWTP